MAKPLANLPNLEPEYNKFRRKEEYQNAVLNTELGDIIKGKDPFCGVASTFVNVKDFHVPRAVGCGDKVLLQKLNDSEAFNTEDKKVDTYVTLFTYERQLEDKKKSAEKKKAKIEAAKDVLKFLKDYRSVDGVKELAGHIKKQGDYARQALRDAANDEESSGLDAAVLQHLEQDGKVKKTGDFAKEAAGVIKVADWIEGYMKDPLQASGNYSLVPKTYQSYDNKEKAVIYALKGLLHNTNKIDEKVILSRMSKLESELNTVNDQIPDLEKANKIVNKIRLDVGYLNGTTLQQYAENNDNFKLIPFRPEVLALFTRNNINIYNTTRAKDQLKKRVDILETTLSKTEEDLRKKATETKEAKERVVELENRKPEPIIDSKAVNIQPATTKTEEEKFDTAEYFKIYNQTRVDAKRSRINGDEE